MYYNAGLCGVGIVSGQRWGFGFAGVRGFSGVGSAGGVWVAVTVLKPKVSGRGGGHRVRWSISRESPPVPSRPGGVMSPEWRPYRSLLPPRLLSSVGTTWAGEAGGVGPPKPSASRHVFIGSWRRSGGFLLLLGAGLSVSMWWQ
ncbi:hypothetical protein BDZ91DRAFT_347721 [Kalaharituber pfeilii]|nr:hypothetical protein BDZ91DRAFT_347721 [Kalaharituber pfeilii]